MSHKIYYIIALDTMSRRFYMVRLKPDEINRTEESVKKNEICIGWGKIAKADEDFNSLEQDISSLKEKLRDSGVTDENLIGRHAGEIMSFFNLEKGDIVAAPIENGQFKIAKVEERKSQYDEKRSIFTKKVEFFSKVFTKKDAPSLVKSFTQLTINNLQKHALTILSLIADQRKIIFFKIGNCEYYDGRIGDAPQGNMEFLQRNQNNDVLGQGHERENFLKKDDGYFYGYVPAVQGNGNLLLHEHFIKGHINDDSDVSFIENMTVIWITAGSDEDGESGYQIAGWYENAIVYSIPQKMGMNPIHYLVKTKDAYLIDQKDRPYYYDLYSEYCNFYGLKSYKKYTRNNNPGQHSAFYLYSKGADLEKRQVWAECVLKWINKYAKNEITSPSDVKLLNNTRGFLRSGSNGTPSEKYLVSREKLEYLVDPLHKKAEENFKEHLEGKKYKNLRFNENYIDCIYEDNKHCYFAEIKPYKDKMSYRYALRDAVGQILEYFYNKKDQYRTNLEIKMVVALVKFGEEEIETNEEFQNMLKEKHEIDIVHISSKLVP